jgi:hypothetical protein
MMMVVVVLVVMMTPIGCGPTCVWAPTPTPPSASTPLAVRAMMMMTVMMMMVVVVLMMMMTTTMMMMTIDAFWVRPYVRVGTDAYVTLGLNAFNGSDDDDDDADADDGGGQGCTTGGCRR